MPAVTARVETPNADRYLTQLCKHFAHKISVDHGEGRGIAEFPWGGTCRLHADGGHLELHCSADDSDGLNKVVAVVDDHLRRFAWREALTPDWKPDAP